MLKTEIAACINNVAQITDCGAKNTFNVYGRNGSWSFLIGDEITICLDYSMITGKVEAVNIPDNIIIVSGEEININKINCMIIY